MLKRKIYDDLLNWKKERHSERSEKCLLIKGARQVGKTYIIDEFGRNEYRSCLHIDFFRQPDLKAIFDGSLEPDEILKKISAYVRANDASPARSGRSSSRTLTAKKPYHDGEIAVL